MRKLLKGFGSEQEAKNYSALLFPNLQGSETQYSYGWRKNPNGTDWALEVIDDVSFLPQERISDLVDDDWIVTQPEFNEFGLPIL